MTTEITHEYLTNLELSKKWNELLEASKSYLKTRPANPAQGYYYQGVAFHELKKYKEAHDSYLQALKLENNDPIIHNALGVLHKDRRNYDEAIKEFDKAYELNNEFINAKINKALAYSLKGNHVEALKIYNTILQENPDMVPVLIFKAECQKELNQNEEAIRTYDHALSIEPNAPDLHFNRGNVFAVNNRNEQALSCYEKAIELDPQLPDSYHYAGLIYQKMGKNNDAVSNFKTAIDKDSQTPLPYLSLGQIYNKINNKTLADKYYQEGINKFPNSPVCAYNFGIHKIRSDNMNEGTNYLSKSVNGFNEPEASKQQLERAIQDIKREKSDIVTKLTSQKEYDGITYSDAGLVNEMDVTTENNQEIIQNISTIKKRVLDSESEIEILKSTKFTYINMKSISPELHKYVSSFLLMQNNYLRNSGFELNKAHTSYLNLNVLQDVNLPSNLTSFTNGDRAHELIVSSTNSHLKSHEFKNKFSQILAPNNEGIDYDDALTEMTKVVLDRVKENNEKKNEIEDYEKTPSKKFINQLIENNPSLKNDITDAPTAIALRDFILFNSYLVNNVNISDATPRNYQREFKNKYKAGVFENIKDSTYIGGVTTFQSFNRKRIKDMAVKIVFDNKQKASSKSKFILQVVIGNNGEVPAIPDYKNPNFKKIYTSAEKVLEEKVTFDFVIRGEDIDDDNIENVFLKVTVSKKKSEKIYVTKTEKNLKLKTLTGELKNLMTFKQNKMLSSKNIQIWISGVRNV